MQYVPELGKIIEGEARRDAIHVAVAPVVAGEDLEPGYHVSLNKEGEAVSSSGKGLLGIVDPYLVSRVKKGERFWLCLYPNTVTSLRHVWTHPAFITKSSEQAKNLPTQEYLSA
jgi:hypothetical protein